MNLKILLILFFQTTLFSMTLQEINKKIEDNNWSINYNEDYLKTAKSEYSKNRCLKEINTALRENYGLYQQKHELEKKQLEEYQKEIKLNNKLKKEQEKLQEQNKLLEENMLLKTHLNNLEAAEQQQDQLNILLQGVGLTSGAGLVLILGYWITSKIDQRIIKSMY